MQWIEAKVIHTSADPETAAELIALIFYGMGLTGVSLEEPGLQPEEGWGDDAVLQPEHHSVSGFFPASELPPDRKDHLLHQLSNLEKQHEIISKVLFRKMDEEDWAESWKEYFWPEKITDKMVVKPSWREYHPGPEELVIEIDPGMAFGTGTHPTTFLCLQLIETYLSRGDSFLDVGTGSGILMVAAARLGACKTWGIDHDPVAVSVAERNLRLNRIPPATYRLFCGDLVASIQEPFQLITANILSEVILNLLDQITPVMTPGGLLICSGIIEDNARAVLDKMASLGLTIREVRKKETWVAITAQSQPNPNQNKIL